MEARRAGRSVVVKRTGQPQVSTVDRDLETLSRWMDSAFEIPGLRWRFGIDAVIGLVPGIGDIVSGGVSFYIIGLAALRYRLPKITLVRMGLNVAIDMLIGAIPFIGDMFDVWWRVNERNIDLIRRRAVGGEAGRRTTTGWDWAFVTLSIGFVLALLYGALFLIWNILASVIGWIF